MTMNLREPKKKRRWRTQPQASLPICTDENGRTRIYTAHLSTSGTCIADPEEMEAVYSMGFFGKGSLSRSFPAFGRRRFGAAPIIRERQWKRRQEWLEELQTLNDNFNSEVATMPEAENSLDRSSESIEKEFPFKDKNEESIEGESNVLDERMEIEEIQGSEVEIKDVENSEIGLKKLLDEKANDDSSKELIDCKKLVDFETKTNVDSSIEETKDEKACAIPAKGPSEDATDSKCSEVELVEKKDAKSDCKEAKDNLIKIKNDKPDIDIDLSAEIIEDMESSKKLEEKSSTGNVAGNKRSNIGRNEKGPTKENNLQANSWIEVVKEGACIKKAKLESCEKKQRERSLSPHLEPTNIDQIVLDSTEEEEICEIVENERDVCVLEDENNDECIVENWKNGSSCENDESTIEQNSKSFEFVVLPDTDSDTENYLKNVVPRIEHDGFPVNETLHLTFEETFFLMYGLGCLQLVHYDGSIFTINDAWKYFQQQDKYFVQKYVVYHYFRSKGWIVKPGMKFGGDFLLYKLGPPFYHASYIVVIEVMDADTLIRDDVNSLRKITWKNLMGLERLSETIAKEILFAQILWPSSILRSGNFVSIESLPDFTIREILWRRWDPKKKDSVIMDDQDSDSM